MKGVVIPEIVEKTRWNGIERNEVIHDWVE